MVGSTELGDPEISLCWLNRGLVTCDGQGGWWPPDLHTVRNGVVPVCGAWDAAAS